MNMRPIQVVLAISSINLLCYACATDPTATKTETKQQDPALASSNQPTVSVVNKNQQDAPKQAGSQNEVVGAKENMTSEIPSTQKSVSNNQSAVSQSFTFEITEDTNPNKFNRLLEKKKSDKSILHDPANPSLKYLQKPAEAFASLPKANTGNKVDWVKAVDLGRINPRHHINDPNITPMVMDLNIIMQVKGSMPDVVFPHKQHTRWLNCSNCHPAIFIPQSGANKMSMADNLLSLKCGVCHGKVAFPLSSCSKCYPNKKIVVQEKKQPEFMPNNKRPEIRQRRLICTRDL